MVQRQQIATDANKVNAAKNAVPDAASDYNTLGKRRKIQAEASSCSESLNTERLRTNTAGGINDASLKSMDLSAHHTKTM